MKSLSTTEHVAFVPVFPTPFIGGWEHREHEEKASLGTRREHYGNTKEHEGTRGNNAEGTRREHEEEKGTRGNRATYESDVGSSTVSSARPTQPDHSRSATASVHFVDASGEIVEAA